ncbi:MAG: ATP-binding protein, partial [Verrucomicrobiia bacterium]
MKAERIVLDGTVEALQPAAAFVERWVEEAGLPGKASYGLQLAVDELVTNIVTHAYAERGRTGQVIMESELDPTHLRVVIEDSGEAYDPTAQPPPDDLHK